MGVCPLTVGFPQPCQADGRLWQRHVTTGYQTNIPGSEEPTGRRIWNFNELIVLSFTFNDVWCMEISFFKCCNGRWCDVRTCSSYDSEWVEVNQGETTKWSTMQMCFSSFARRREWRMIFRKTLEKTCSILFRRRNTPWIVHNWKIMANGNATVHFDLWVYI